MISDERIKEIKKRVNECDPEYGSDNVIDEACELLDDRQQLVAELEALRDLAIEYDRFVETMTGINQHRGYLFTQPIMDGTKKLKDWKAVEKVRGDG